MCVYGIQLFSILWFQFFYISNLIKTNYFPLSLTETLKLMCYHTAFSDTENVSCMALQARDLKT